MRRHHHLAVLLLIAFTVPARPQVIDRSILNSAVWITYEAAVAQGKTSASISKQPRRVKPSMMGGTGFLLFHNIGVSKGQVYLVTNKHLLPPEGSPQSIKLRVAVHDRDGKTRVDAVTIPVTGADGKYLHSVHLHPDRDTDVVAINIALTAFQSKFQVLTDALSTGNYLDTSMLATSSSKGNNDFGVGSSVYLIGFPASLFDPRNVSPVLRLGVIATNPAEGFSFNDHIRQTTNLPQHINGFLVDANVYPGSSGSLVIAMPEKGSQDEGSGSARPQILGIVSGSIPIFDPSLKSYERVGLGIVYSAETIREAIQSSQ